MKPEIPIPVVPDAVFQSVCNALESFQEEHYQAASELRVFLTKRFAKDRIAGKFDPLSSEYRHGASAAHRLIYALVSTVAANAVDMESVNSFLKSAYPEVA